MNGYQDILSPNIESIDQGRYFLLGTKTVNAKELFETSKRSDKECHVILCNNLSDFESQKEQLMT